MRTFWAIVAGALVFFIGRHVSSMLLAQWTIDTLMAARLPPEPGKYIGSYDIEAVITTAIARVSANAFCALLGSTICAAIAPLNAYRCAVILWILSVGEVVAWQWWMESMVGPQSTLETIMAYAIQLPEFMAMTFFLFIGAVLGRRLRRQPALPPLPTAGR